MARPVDEDFKDATTAGYVGAWLFGVFGLVFALCLLVAIVVALGAVHLGDDGTDEPRIVAAILVPFLALCAGVFALLFAWSLRNLRRWKRLRTSTVTAWGTLGGWRSSPTKLNTRRLHVFSMTVTPADSPPQGAQPYEAEAKWFLPGDLESTLAPGARVVVRVDPQDRRNVVIDWPLSRAAWAGSSAQADIAS